MIALRRLNNQEFVVNADLIETVEATPDTMITLTNGRKIMIRNSIEDVVRKAIKYRQLCNQTLQIVQREVKDDPCDHIRE